jgi:hypothetical protein
MRTFSTPQSALNLEITKLAIVECVVAILVYVGAGIYLGSFKYLAVAVVFAPLMLFRTDASANWGLRAYSQIMAHPNRTESIGALLIFIFLGPLIGVAIRTVATVGWAVYSPLYTFKEMPKNWLRQTICTDVAHVPEIVPLEALESPDSDVPTFMEYVEIIRKNKGLFNVFFIVASLPFVLVGWLPALVYRISFKATSLVYAPLIWVTHLTLENPLPLKARLERITKGELEKVRRGLSWLVLGSLIVKLAFLLALVDRTYLESKFPSARIATTFVIPDHWPWWQITLTIDALLTFVLFFFADAAITRIETQQTWSDNFVLNIVTSASFLRAVLSIVTISYFFYVALLAAFPSVISRLSLS